VTCQENYRAPIAGTTIATIPSAEVPVLSCRGDSIRQDGVPGQASYRKVQPSHYYFGRGWRGAGYRLT
jgi:hypothetical protein